MSFLKLYEDFLQKKEGENRFHTSGNDAAGAEQQDSSARSDGGAAITADSNLTTANTTDNNINSTSSGYIKNKKMEHSYMRGEIRNFNTAGLTPSRTIIVRRPPQCSSCHHHPMDEDEMEDDNKVPVPAYNEIAAKDVMNECCRIAKFVKNPHSDDEIWEDRIVQYNWTASQKRLFDSVTKILDRDYLGRLAYEGRQHEAMYRRLLIDTSSSSFRKALADISWDVRLTQWLHGLLMENLPPTYLASYLDILQTLKTKVPLLMDKMLFGRPMNCSQELLAPVMKPRWQLGVCQKQRKLTQNIVIVIIPSNFGLGKPSQRLLKWQQQLSSFAEIVNVTLPTGSPHILQQPLEVIAEQIVSLTRVKIQELRNENPTRSIFLLGLNASSAMALQVAMSVSISAVVCLGFAYNTLNGVRGSPDDRILDIKIPILFVIGQNAARTSQEEMESLRERMQSETALIIVGSADDVLRVPKSRRVTECVTQSMVDTMIVDEVYEYIKRTLALPPGPRTPMPIAGVFPRVGKNTPLHNVTNDGSLHANIDGKTPMMHRKRKVQELHNDASTPKNKFIGAKKAVAKTVKQLNDDQVLSNDWENYEVKIVKPTQKRKVGRPRLRPLPGQIDSGTATTTGNITMNASPKKFIDFTQEAIECTDEYINDDILMSDAIQNILYEHEIELANSNNIFLESSSSSGKPMTSFELVPQPSKTSPLKTQPTTTLFSTPSTKIKIIPSNQFVQLKPGNGGGVINTGHLQTPSQIYTIKNSTPTGIGNIVSTTPVNKQPQIITLKTTPSTMGQSKFTLVKNNNRVQLSNATVTTAPMTAATTTAATPTPKTNVDISSIINLPIVFADQQGNLSEAVNVASAKANTGAATTIATTTTATTTKPMKFNIINQKIYKPVSNTGGNVMSDATKQSTVKIGGQTYVLNNPAIDPKKVVLINPSTSNAFGRGGVTTNSTTTSAATVGQQTVKYATILRPGTHIVPISAASAVSGLKQIDLNTSCSSSSGIQRIKIISPPINSTNLSNLRSIVLKPGNFQQFPANMKNQLLSYNNKLSNFVPVKKLNVQKSTNITTTATATTTLTTLASTTSSKLSSGIMELKDANVVVSSPRQTAPKIITIDPLESTSTSFMDDVEEYTTMSIDD